MSKENLEFISKKFSEAIPDSHFIIHENVQTFENELESYAIFNKQKDYEEYLELCNEEIDCLDEAYSLTQFLIIHDYINPSKSTWRYCYNAYYPGDFESPPDWEFIEDKYRFKTLEECVDQIVANITEMD
jgi:hypothetical protein